MDPQGGLAYDPTIPVLPQVRARDAVLRPGIGCMFKRVGWQEPIFKHVPVATDIQQTHLGNCYLLSALLAIVDNNPHYINDMMKDNHDGTVAVRLYNSQLTPIIILIDKTIYCKNYTFVLKQATWVYLIEKAYAALRQITPGFLYTPEHGEPRSPENIAEALSGGFSSDAFQILFGGDVQNIDIRREGYFPNINLQADDVQGGVDLEPEYPDSSVEYLQQILTYNHHDDGPDKYPVAFNRVFGEANAVLKRHYSWQTNTATQAAMRQHLIENTNLNKIALHKAVRDNFRNLNAATGRLLHQFIAYVEPNTPFKFLYTVFTYNRQSSIEEPTDAVNIVFGDTKAIAKREFLYLTTAETQRRMQEFFAANVPIRREKFQHFLRDVFPRMPAVCFEALNDFFVQHIPCKRGSTSYVTNQRLHYQIISNALAQGHLVCLGTMLNIGSEERFLRVPQTTKVKGLVKTHAYQVINVYQRHGLCFILIRNPWAEYTRGYAHKPASYHLSAKAYTQQPKRLFPDAPIENRVIDFVKPINKLYKMPGVFELELSNLTKRFARIYIGSFRP